MNQPPTDPIRDLLARLAEQRDRDRAQFWDVATGRTVTENPTTKENQ